MPFPLSNGFLLGSQGAAAQNSTHQRHSSDAPSRGRFTDWMVAPRHRQLGSFGDVPQTQYHQAQHVKEDVLTQKNEQIMDILKRPYRRRSSQSDSQHNDQMQDAIRQSRRHSCSSYSESSLSQHQQQLLPQSHLPPIRPRFKAPLSRHNSERQEGQELQDVSVSSRSLNSTGTRRLDPIRSYLRICQKNEEGQARNQNLSTSNSPYQIGELFISHPPSLSRVNEPSKQNSNPARNNSSYSVDCLGERFKGFSNVFLDNYESSNSQCKSKKLPPHSPNTAESHFQASFYESTVSPLVHEFVNRQRNICIVVHGHDGSGRSRTLFGTNLKNSDEKCASNFDTTRHLNNASQKNNHDENEQHNVHRNASQSRLSQTTLQRQGSERTEMSSLGSCGVSEIRDAVARGIITGTETNSTAILPQEISFLCIPPPPSLTALRRSVSPLNESCEQFDKAEALMDHIFDGQGNIDPADNFIDPQSFQGDHNLKDSPNKTAEQKSEETEDGIVPMIIDDVFNSFNDQFVEFPSRLNKSGGQGRKDGIPIIIPEHQSSASYFKKIQTIRDGDNNSYNRDSEPNRTKTKRKSSQTCDTDVSFVGLNSQLNDGAFKSLRVSCVEVIDDLACGECSVKDLLSESYDSNNDEASVIFDDSGWNNSEEDDNDVIVGFGTRPSKSSTCKSYMSSTLPPNKIKHDEVSGVTYVEGAVEMRCYSYGATMDCILSAEKTRKRRSSLDSTEQDTCHFDKLYHTVYFVSVELCDSSVPGGVSISRQMVISRIDESMSNSASLALHSSYLALSSLVKDLTNYSKTPTKRKNELTKLLRECFAGECATVVIGTANPERGDAVLPTLRFGEAVGHVFNFSDRALDVDPPIVKVKKVEWDNENITESYLPSRNHNSSTSAADTEDLAENNMNAKCRPKYARGLSMMTAPMTNEERLELDNVSESDDDAKEGSAYLNEQSRQQRNPASLRASRNNVGYGAYKQISQRKSAESLDVDTKNSRALDHSSEQHGINKSGSAGMETMDFNQFDTATNSTQCITQESMVHTETHPFETRRSEVSDILPQKCDTQSKLSPINEKCIRAEVPVECVAAAYNENMNSTESTKNDVFKVAKAFLAEASRSDLAHSTDDDSYPASKPTWLRTASDMEEGLEHARAKIVSDDINEMKPEQYANIQPVVSQPAIGKLSEEDSKHSAKERDCVIDDMQREIDSLRKEKDELLKRSEQKNKELELAERELQEAREEIYYLKIQCGGETSVKQASGLETGECDYIRPNRGKMLVENDNRSSSLIDASNYKKDNTKDEETLSPVDEPIRVCLRIRPPNKVELNQRNRGFLEVEDDSQHLCVSSPLHGEFEFKFDKVFGEDSTQINLFNHVRDQGLLEKLTSGINCCIVAYGAPLSGKSHTLIGDIPEISEYSSNEFIVDDSGLFPRLITSLFEEMRRSRKSIEYSVRCSCVTVHFERIIDLLDPQSNRSIFVSESSTGIQVEGAAESHCFDEKDVFSAVSSGYSCQQGFVTRLDIDPQQLHTFFFLTIEQHDTLTGKRKSSKLCVADLASVPSTADFSSMSRDDDRIFRRSFSSLQSVIKSLQTNCPDVPYRASKITTLLKDALGGNCFTMIMITASSNRHMMSETCEAIRLGHEARKVTNKLRVNEVVASESISSTGAMLEQLSTLCVEFCKEFQRKQKRGLSEMDQSNKLLESIREVIAGQCNVANQRDMLDIRNRNLLMDAQSELLVLRRQNALLAREKRENDISLAKGKQRSNELTMQVENLKADLETSKMREKLATKVIKWLRKLCVGLQKDIDEGKTLEISEITSMLDEKIDLSGMTELDQLLLDEKLMTSTDIGDSVRDLLHNSFEKNRTGGAFSESVSNGGSFKNLAIEEKNSLAQREQQLRRDLKKMANKNVELQVLLNREREFVESIVSNTGELNTKRIAQEILSMKSERERITHAAKSVVWKLNEANMANKILEKKSQDATRHMEYIEESFQELQKKLQATILESNETEAALREKFDSLDSIFGPLRAKDGWKASRLNMPIVGKDDSIEPIPFYDQRQISSLSKTAPHSKRTRSKYDRPLKK